MSPSRTQPLDPVALLDRLTDLIDFANQGEGGLPVLQRIVELATAATGATGAAFIGYTPSGGHLVAATSSLTWAVGLPVGMSEPEAVTMLAAESGQQTRVDQLPPEMAGLVRGRGIERVLSAAGFVGRSLVGSLHACFPDADGPADPHQIAAMRVLAAAAARMYRESTDLPLYPDGPAPGQRGAAPAPVSQEREQGRDLFIAMTSHELRTPVTVIKGYADTLVGRWDSLDDSARREAVRVVWQRARELARLVDRLLNAASGLTGVIDGSTVVPFDPAQVLRDAVLELSPDLRRNLLINLPHTLPKVRGDRASFSTVLTELVTNACKYSPDRVDVELTAGSDAYTLWIRVADRGLGIRSEHAERAFERFWQLERDDQRQYGGVGLGLYLVRKIVERQNGWVSLRPREGGGAVAEVRLPRADAGDGVT
ncbi:MAG TPA: HAMP domain-containing sensor histidine kinase [Planosporangium sp.]|jgi:two-component sensor histidine kinase|nr:HAMP domain-containing sensor histidine kinase [Planosporangium sp.]